MRSAKNQSLHFVEAAKRSDGPLSGVASLTGLAGTTGTPVAMTAGWGGI